MTEDQAYTAMFNFLERLYTRTKSNDLGWMLGSMSRLEDGSTVDPVMMREWKSAVEDALNGGTGERLVLKK